MKLITYVTFYLSVICTTYAQQYGWNVIYKPQDGAVDVIDFVDSLHGWINTREGIRRTNDGGLTWSEPKKSIVCNALNFINAKEGWILGYDGLRGYIYSSVDSGKTISLFHKKDYQLLKIGKGTSINKFIAVGINNYNFPKPDTSVLVKTTDGGKTFTETSFADSPFVYYKMMDFIDSSHGWIYGEYDSTGISSYPNKCTILLTSDGGNTWKRLNVNNTRIQKFETVCFLDTLKGWGWYYGQMFKTDDGAKSWRKIWPIGDSQIDLGIFKITFIDPSNGWCCGNAFINGGVGEVIYKTIDGGINWYEESAGLSTSCFDMVMLSKSIGYVAADEAVLKYSSITGIKKQKDLQFGYYLEDNYPNPFNLTTIIEYHLPEPTWVELKIYDMLGREIAALVNELQSAGVYKKQFDARNLASGNYFYRLKTRNFQLVKQMLLLK